MPGQRDRIIVDTNLWISFLLTKDYSKLDKILSDNLATLLFSQELLDEFITVAYRPKFRKYFSASDIKDLLIAAKEKSEIVTVHSTIEKCRDAKDNFLLALAADGNATHLITGDNDLLVLKKIELTRIVTISEYISDK